MQRAILSSVDQFGQPRVVSDGGTLRVQLEKLDAVQTLFAMDGEALSGVLVYSRTSEETLSVIYIAVNDEYSSHGRYANKMLFLRMLALVKNTARRIKGIKAIQIISDENQTISCSV